MAVYGLKQPKKKKKREEEERLGQQAAEAPSSDTPEMPEPAQPQQPKQEAAKPDTPKQPENVTIRQVDGGVKADIGPTNRPMDADAAFLLEQRKQIRDVDMQLTETSDLEDLPETLTPHREALQEKNDGGGFIPSSVRNWGHNKADIYLDTIKDERQLAYTLSVLGSDQERVGLAKAWSDLHGLNVEDVIFHAEELLGERAFSAPQSAQGRLNAIGMVDLNGERIDMGSADFAQIVNAAQCIPDDDLRKQAFADIKALTKMKGGRFYGISMEGVSDDYRDTRDMPKAAFDSYADGLNAKFYGSEGHDVENLRMYLTQYDSINGENSPLNGVQKHWYTQALNRAFVDQVYGGRGGVPDAEQARELLAQYDEAEAAQGEETESEDEPGFFEGIKNAVSSFLEGFRGEDEPEEAGTEAPEAAEAGSPQQAEPESEASEEQAEEPLTEAEQETSYAEPEDAQAGAAEVQGPIYRPEEGSGTAASAAPERASLIGDTATQLEYMHTGRFGEMDDASQAELRTYWHNASPATKAVMGLLTPEMQTLYESGNEGAESVQMMNTGIVGSSLARYAYQIQDESFPPELYGKAVLAIDQIVRAAEGDVTITQADLQEWGNRNEVYLSRHPEALAGIEGVFAELGSMQQAEADYAAKVQADAKAELDRIGRAALVGQASDVQMAQLAASAGEISPFKLRRDDTFSQMKRALDDTYWRAATESAQAGDSFFTSTVYNMMKSRGVSDLDSSECLYEEMLHGQMNALLEQDAKVAATLGIPLEDLYRKWGGMNLDLLCQRANAEIRRSGAGLTQETIDAAEALVGDAGEKLGLGLKNVGELSVGIAKESVVSGFLETFITTTALTDTPRDVARVVSDYTQMYGPEGQSVYAREMRTMAESGRLPEGLSKIIIDYLDEGGNPYQLGIHPKDYGGVSVDAYAESQDRLRWYQGLIDNYATEGEAKAIEVGSNTASSTALVLMSAAATQGIGGVMIAAGAGAKATTLLAPFLGSRIVYGENQRGALIGEYAAKGYSKDEAMFLAETRVSMEALANATSLGHLNARLGGYSALVKNGLVKLGGANTPKAVQSVFQRAVMFGKPLLSELGEEAIKDPILEGIYGEGGEAAAKHLIEAAREGDVGVGDIAAAIGTGAAAGVAAIPGTVEETIRNAPETIMMTLPIAILGAGGEYIQNSQSAKAAQAFVEQPTAKNAEALDKAVAQDAKDGRWIDALRQEGKTAEVEQTTSEILIHAPDKQLYEAAQKTREQANSHKAELESTEARLDTIRQSYADRKAAGDVDGQVREAREFAMATQGKAEHERELAQKTTEAKAAESALVQDAHDRAVMEVDRRHAVSNQQAQAAQEQRAQTEIRQREEGNLSAMDAEAFIEERYPDASEEEKQAIRTRFESANAQVEQRVMRDGVEALRSSVQLASRLSKKYDLPIRFVKSLDGAEGLYDGKTVYVSMDATQGEVIQRVLVHEMTHAAEGTESYKEMARVLLRLKYGGDYGQMQADIQAKMNRYADHYKKVGRTDAFTKEDALREIVADYNGTLLSGDEEMIRRFVDEEPSMARKVYESIRRFVRKVRGLSDPRMDQIRKAEKLFERALDEKRNARQQTRNAQYAGREIRELKSEGDKSSPVGVMPDGTAVRYSLASWTDSEKEAARTALNTAGFPARDVERWIDQTNSVAAVIAADKNRLDFEAADNQVMLKENAEYVKTLDASTLCAKRLLYQGTFDAIQHELPDHVFTSEELLDLLNLMKDEGYETPCGVCYVESRRRHLGKYAAEWLDGYDAKGGYQPKLDDVTTTDGLERMRHEHPEVYKSFVDTMNSKGSNNPKVVQLRTDYRGDIRRMTKSQIEKVVRIGGLRVQSFSDFETPHLLDMMQAVLDMAGRGLTSQAYTKVPNFAWVFGDTGIKINLSLMAEGRGVDENGNLIFSSSEGMDIDEAMKLRERYSENVGTIIVGANDDHIRAAMADPRIDYIIPFHRSGWGKNELQKVGVLQTYEDYQAHQNERRITGYTKAGEPKFSPVKGGNFYPIDYWDYSKSGDENAATYLRMCEEDDRVPKFEQFLTRDADGYWIAPSGYWKMLIDFKMYDNNGVGAPQRAVTPDVNMDEAMRVLDEYEGGANELPVAQDIVDRFVEEISGRGEGRVRYSLPEESNITIQPAAMPDDTYTHGRTIDRNKAIADGMENVRSKNSKFNIGNKVFAENKQTGRPIQVTKESLRHGMSGGIARQSRNARMSAVIGDVLEDAVRICELKPRNNVVRAYAMMGAIEDGEMVYPVKIVVNETGEDMGDLTGIEAFNGIAKQYLYSANAEEGTKKEPVAISPEVQGASPNTLTGSDIRIADLWDSVKTHFMENLDVLDDGPRYSLPSDDALDAEINAWRSAHEAEMVHAATLDGESQFARTAQKSPDAPEWWKREVRENSLLKNYAKEVNAEQMKRATRRIAAAGYEAEVQRLLDSDSFDADDTVEAGALMNIAFGQGDVSTALDMALKYRTDGREHATALQSRKMFAGMTPTNIKIKVAGEMEAMLTEYVQNHQPRKRRVHREAEKIDEMIRNLTGGDELQRMAESGEIDVSKVDNKWGVPINEKQKKLIDHYKLNDVPRPGIHYNRATLKQRMLEAILCTPDPDKQSGNGLTLTQRLEWMKDGKTAVITQADLAYIADRISEYSIMPEDEQSERAGDLALARAYEAYGNIAPASGREKARTWRYTSMLLSLPSAMRNVIGNSAQGALNATADGIAVELDRLASLFTKERTRAHLTMPERINGWYEFAQETRNTGRDVFADRAITAHGEDRYNLNQRGRVFQNPVFETMRLIEGYLMSVGDRNFYRKKYINSLAEQYRVAEMNGVELDYEQAADQAEAEAKYATFNEDSAVRGLFTQAKGIPVFGEVVDFLMPFTGVPTNIVRRMYQYSPAGLAVTAIKHGMDAAQGKNFDQRAFVDGMARGLTGTALFAVGMALMEAGKIHLGTGAEDDEKLRNLQAAQGAQYSPYIQVGDENVSLAAFAPSVSPIIMGATAYEIFRDDEVSLSALVNACLAGADQIFDASYMSAIQDVFKGYGSPSQNLMMSAFNSAVSQNVPSVISQIATSMDQYVRDTKDASYVMQALKSGLIQKIPGMRQKLEPKTDITGTPIRSKEGWRNFADPFTTTEVNDSPVLAELERLYEATGSSSHIPTYLIANSGKVQILAEIADPIGMDRSAGEHKFTVTAKERSRYNRMYGQLIFEGGEGVTGINDIMRSPEYMYAGDGDKAEMISKVIAQAKRAVQRKICSDRGWKL